MNYVTWKFECPFFVIINKKRSYMSKLACTRFCRTNREFVRFSLIGGTPLAECCVWLRAAFTLYLEGDVVVVGD